MIINREFLKGLPKAELHIHLRGSLQPSYLHRLVTKYGLKDFEQRCTTRHLAFFKKNKRIAQLLKNGQSTEEACVRLFEKQDLVSFLQCYLFSGYFFREIEDLRALITELKLQQAEQNVVYSEVTISLNEYLEQGLNLHETLQLLENERIHSNGSLNWILDLVRNYGPEKCESVLMSVANSGINPFCGITLGGSEREFPADLFGRLYELGRDLGLKTSCHAGESAGVESVRTAVYTLKCDRIGHGFCALQDTRLTDHLREHQIALELCPSSNISTGVVKTLQDIPFRGLIEAEVPFTINTDDPSFFATDISTELLLLDRIGLQQNELFQLMRNAYDYSFAEKHHKDRLLGQFKKALQAALD